MDKKVVNLKPKKPEVLLDTCGNCVNWAEGDAIGPVTIGQPARGICFGVPPTPVMAMDKTTGNVGQMNLRPQTLATETACSLFDPGEDLPDGGQ
jgi:hypothetical protein